MTGMDDPRAHDPSDALGPPTIIAYVCRECSSWTTYRRSRCAWCPCTLAPEIIQYTREGSD